VFGVNREGPRIAAAVLAAALAAGCAAARAERMSFAEAGFSSASLAEEPEAPPAPPVAEPAPRQVATERPSGPPVDALLLAFAAEARARRARTAGPRGFPAEAQAAWTGLARELERYLTRPMPQTPLLELVRARVAVEVELELDRRRFGEAPSGLTAALDPLLRRLAARAQAARALGERLVLRESPPPALRWPIEGAGLSSPFGMRIHPLDGARRMHFGIDLSAAPGRAVSAAAPGWVVSAGWAASYGILVEVRHEGGLTTRYSHLSRALCHPGDAVEPGQAVGLVGQTGRATGPHLHFEVWKGGEARDPLAWLHGRPDDDRLAVR
jgi:murein DD-endopeptidase MepM/ murein hydrolase activator NlpD